MEGWYAIKPTQPTNLIISFQVFPFDTTNYMEGWYAIKPNQQTNQPTNQPNYIVSSIPFSILLIIWKVDMP